MSGHKTTVLQRYVKREPVGVVGDIHTYVSVRRVENSRYYPSTEVWNGMFDNPGRRVVYTVPTSASADPTWKWSNDFDILYDIETWSGRRMGHMSRVSECGQRIVMLEYIHFEISNIRCPRMQYPEQQEVIIPAGTVYEIVSVSNVSLWMFP